jgi:hypothetical protein
MSAKKFPTRIGCRALSAACIALLPIAGARADGADRPFLPHVIVSSTIPANGDLNPYGIAFVPKGFPAGGPLAPGDILVSNFNNSGNLQGTGTTIIKLTPDGTVAPSVAVGQNGNAVTFFQGQQVGLTTALGVLGRGFVVVGNVPTTDGTANTLSQGALQVVDRNGNLVSTLSDATFLDSPWDLTVHDNGTQAQIFVSNVLSGTVSRLDVSVGASTVTVLNKILIATGYKHEPNAAALIVGPTGLAFDEAADVLYVASTDDNAIFAVPHAGTATHPVVRGTPVFADPHLHGPLGLAFAPGGHLLTANGDAINPDPTHPSEIVEFTKSGEFVREFNLDAGADAAFGIATVLSDDAALNFAVVNDNTNGVAVYDLTAQEDEFAVARP